MEINDPIPDRWHQVLDAYMADPRKLQGAAYRSVYTECSAKTGAAGAHKVFNDPRVLEELKRRRQPLKDANALEAQMVLKHLHDLVNADPRDLVEYRRGACRYCHGAGHEKQRTPKEYREDLAAYKLLNETRDPSCVGFSVAGGVGFNPNKAPHPDCPECHGQGEGYVYAKDMRLLTPAQAQLYASIKQTEHGFEIKTRDKTKALELAMRTLGLLRDQEPDENSNVPPAGTVHFGIVDGRRTET